MRIALLCLMLALPASAASLDDLLRTPPWEVGAGDAAEVLRPVIESIRAADRHALDAWIEHPEGESPLGPRLLDNAAAALGLDGFTHPIDPLDELPDPDLEPLRTLGRLLAADAIRLGGENEWPAAASRLRATVRLGHHLGEAPGLTRVLVGVAVHQRVVQALEALAGTPGMPNFHDTLADLSNQRIDVLPAAWTQLARPALNDPLVQEARDAVDHPERLDDAAWDALLHRLVLALAVGWEPDPEDPDAPPPPLPPAVEAAIARLSGLYADDGFHAIALRGEDPNGAARRPAARRRRALHLGPPPRRSLGRHVGAVPRAAGAIGGGVGPRPRGEPPAPLRLHPPARARRRRRPRPPAESALQGAEALRLHAAREGRFPATL